MSKHYQDRLGKLLVFGSIGTLLLLGTVAAVWVGRLPKIGPQGCIVGQPPSGYTAIVVDMTDPLSEAQCATLVRRIQRLAAEELVPNEMLSVWALGDFDDEALHPLFCTCDPGTDVNFLAQSRKLTLARRDSLFGHPLEQAMANFAQVRTAPRSPILEGIEEVTELKDFVEARGCRRIVLASDLLQNSTAYSNYRQGCNLVALQCSPAMQSLKGKLANVSVDILYIPRRRDEALQGASLRAFWRRGLEACGAKQVSFERL